MSLLSTFGHRAPKPTRRLPAEQLAEIDIEHTIYESRQNHEECIQEAEACELEAQQARAKADVARSRRHFDYPLTTLTTVWGVFAWLAMAANWFLEMSMFTAMNIPAPVAALLATIGTAVFGGVGAYALHHLRGPKSAKIIGGALLTTLVLVAAFLVPVLAKARADEMYAERLTDAQALVTVSRAMSDRSTGDRIRLDKARQDMPVLTAQRETAQTIFTVLLAMTLFTEVVLAGYGFDLLTRRRATRLDKRAVRLDAAATEARNDALAEDNRVRQELAGIAARHALSVDTMDRLLRNRLLAAGKVPTTVQPPESGQTPQPSVASATATAGETPSKAGSESGRQPGSGASPAPAPLAPGTITTVDPPAGSPAAPNRSTDDGMLA